MTGIYKITSPSGSYYFGQSRNIKKRFLSYKRYDCKKQPLIYRSLLKYGSENHKFEVIHEFEENCSQHTIDNYECFYIRQHSFGSFRSLNVKPGGRIGYMSEDGKARLSRLRKGVARDIFKGEGNPFFGKKHTEETRRKMSDHNRMHKTGSNNGRARAILQYDLNSNFIREWDTVTNASKALNINRLTISSALSGDNKTAKGFIFKYKTPK